MLLLHANDMLDHRIIEHGGFVPFYSKGSAIKAVKEIVNMVNMTLRGRDLYVILTSTRLPDLKFDRRRL